MTKSLFVAVLGLSGALGCAGSADAGQSADGETAAAAPASTEGGEESPCGPGGFISGLGEGECAAVAGHCCYESVGKACDVMECDGTCNASDSIPAQVSCE